MAKKEDTRIPLPGDAGHTFEDQDFVLNYRPTIDFVEPEQVDLDEDAVPPSEEVTIDTLRDRTQKLINGYRAVAKLADLAQTRVDQRAATMKVKLDPVKDQITIAAVKRCFPEKADPTEITYDDYKSCVQKMQDNAPAPPAVTAEAIRAATSDPFRTDFGGFSNQQGENRPEISSPAASVQPLDLGAFQKAGILALYAMMRPLVKLDDSVAINKHLSSAGHLGGAPDVPVGV